jgi:hypothetical protein
LTSINVEQQATVRTRGISSRWRRESHQPRLNANASGGA